ncbi:hypothetical protein PGTUg99_021066 [Puccinia graminis f. sp. tritici]|uniref:Saposin B-type domain-containing protein n=1 Tax=Puccinia graminis f. sp. tritici TaxID=56615 RepID=A0A5B0SJM6_PUCGR|nr:hypothetical protein PGTUg99_021066 [Puccinia graminis f. sp. tritici]
MALHQLVLVVVISLLYLQSSLQQTKPQPLKDIECGQIKEFEAGDCPRCASQFQALLALSKVLSHQKGCQSTRVVGSLTSAFSCLSTANRSSAYRKIIYDPDSTLDQTERSVERTSGSCVTRIDNPKFMNVPKGIIEDAFDQIGAKCNGRVR